MDEDGAVLLPMLGPPISATLPRLPLPRRSTAPATWVMNVSENCRVKRRNLIAPLPLTLPLRLLVAPSPLPLAAPAEGTNLVRMSRRVDFRR